jgi:hypothetical protein
VTLNPPKKSLRVAPMGQSLVALVAAFAFYFSVLLASSPALHELWHTDAGDTAHQCAVKHFSRDQFVTPHTATSLAAVENGFVLQLLPADSFVPSASDLRLAPGRAPPASA